jgi:hypothetical protein
MINNKFEWKPTQSQIANTRAYPRDLLVLHTTAGAPDVYALTHIKSVVATNNKIVVATDRLIVSSTRT